MMSAMATHLAGCACCDGQLDENHRRYNYVLPDDLADLSEAELAQQATFRSDAMIHLSVNGWQRAYARALMTVALDDGRQVTFGVWIRVASEAEYIDFVTYHREASDKPTLTFTGNLTNAVQPWGQAILGATVRVQGTDPRRTDNIVTTDHLLLARVLTEPWSASEVLATRLGY